MKGLILATIVLFLYGCQAVPTPLGDSQSCYSCQGLGLGDVCNHTQTCAASQGTCITQISIAEDDVWVTRACARLTICANSEENNADECYWQSPAGYGFEGKCSFCCTGSDCNQLIPANFFSSELDGTNESEDDNGACASSDEQWDDTCGCCNPAPGGTTKPKPGGTTRPKPGGTTRPKPGGTTRPKPGGTTRPKPGGTTRPKPGGTTRPKPGGTTRPKPGGTTRPKPGGTTRPKPGGTTRPKPGGTTRPKPGGTTRPKPGGTTRPKPGGTTRPKPGGTTKPNRPATGPPATRPPKPNPPATGPPATKPPTGNGDSSSGSSSSSSGGDSGACHSHGNRPCCDNHGGQSVDVMVNVHIGHGGAQKQTSSVKQTDNNTNNSSVVIASVTKPTDKPTDKPTTTAPTTVAPVTAASTTVAPTSAAPASQTSSAQVAITQAPATAQSSTTSSTTPAATTTPPPTTPTPTTTASTTASTPAASTASPTTTGPPYLCYVCSDPTCSSQSQTTCGTGSEYCMTTVQQLKDGTRVFNKGCVKKAQCESEWWQKTATRSECMANIDDSVTGPPNMPMTCSFCCTDSLCNEFVRPQNPLSYYVGSNLP